MTRSNNVISINVSSTTDKLEFIASAIKTARPEYTHHVAKKVKLNLSKDLIVEINGDTTNLVTLPAGEIVFDYDDPNVTSMVARVSGVAITGLVFF